MQTEKPALPGRILCAACAAYTAGIAAFALFSPPLAAAAAIIIVFIFAALFKKLPFFFTLLIICASFFAGISHFHFVKLSDEKFIDKYSGRYLTLTGKVTDTSLSGTDFQSITMSVHSLTCLDKTEKVDFSVNLFTDRNKSFSPGDILTFSDILNPADKTSSHSFDYGLYLHTKDVSASFSLSSEYISITDGEPSLPGRLRLFSHSLAERMRTIISGEEGEVAAAITLGDKSGLSDDLTNVFRKSGISHIVAVSGMHLSVLMGFFFFLAARSRLHYKLRNIFGVLLVLSYMALTGFSPSVTRAGIMTICVLLAAVFDKKEDIVTSFFFSAAVILIINPYTICNASFLLSYLSLAGILIFANPLRSLLKRLQFIPGFIKDNACTSLSAWLLTVPAVTIMFGGISLVSLPANILIIPFISTIFISSLFSLAAGFIFAPAGAIIALVPRMLIKIVLFCARGFSALPFSHINIKTPGTCELICFSVVLVLLYLVVTGRNPGKAGFAALCAVICFSLFSFSTSALTYSVTFLDIGQGDCILIKSPGNHNYLIDTGPDADTTLSALRSKGVNRLDAIFISHADKDHSGALSDILDEFIVHKVVLPNYDITGEKLSALALSATYTGVNVEYADRYISYKLSGMTADVLWPPPGISDSDKENENSLVIMLDIKGNKFLFTGDIDFDSENAIIKTGKHLDADILKAAHHGSDDSGSDGFLSRVTADYTVISVGTDNFYDHPHEDTLSRLEKAGSNILRTDLSGDIKFTINLLGNMSVKCEGNYERN